MIRGAILILMCAAASVMASPTGAPNTCCEAMIPGHGAEVQTGDVPFTTTPDKEEIQADGKVTLTIASNSADKTFKGYLVVAHMEGMEHFVGAFQSPSDGQILDCFLSDNTTVSKGAATHNNNTEKTSVTVEWIPNGFVGTVVFKTTYVLKGDTYWVKQESPKKVKVIKESEPTGGAEAISSGKAAMWISLAILFLTISVQ